MHLTCDLKIRKWMSDLVPPKISVWLDGFKCELQAFNFFL